MSYHIPKQRVENDGDDSDTEAGVTKVDVLGEFFHWRQVNLRKETGRQSCHSKLTLSLTDGTTATFLPHNNLASCGLTVTSPDSLQISGFQSLTFRFVSCYSGQISLRSLATSDAVVISLTFRTRIRDRIEDDSTSYVD